MFYSFDFLWVPPASGLYFKQRHFHDFAWKADVKQLQQGPKAQDFEVLSEGKQHFK